MEDAKDEILAAIATLSADVHGLRTSIRVLDDKITRLSKTVGALAQKALSDIELDDLGIPRRSSPAAAGGPTDAAGGVPMAAKPR